MFNGYIKGPNQQLMLFLLLNFHASNRIAYRLHSAVKGIGPARKKKVGNCKSVLDVKTLKLKA